MRLESTLSIYGGGPGSGCNPEVGKCGRPESKAVNLSEDQKKAVYTYAGPGFSGDKGFTTDYKNVNAELRKYDGYERLLNKPVYTEQQKSKKETLIKTIQNLDSAVALHVIPHDMEVFRGMDVKTRKSLLDDLKPGDTFKDQAFLSTTTVKAHAEEFAGSSVVMKIKLAQGSVGMVVPAELSKGNVSENEVLMPRNSELLFGGKKGNVYEFSYGNS